MNLIRCFIFLIFSTQLIAQCPENEVELLKQSDVDSFRILYPICDTLTDLYISNNVTSLANLIGIKYVENLSITNTTDLTDLSGLDSLQFIDNELLVNNNERLINLNALSNLEGLSNLLIQGNENLESLVGFEKLIEIGVIRILDNVKIKDLSGFSNLHNCRSLSLSGDISFQGLFLLILNLTV